MPSRKAIVFAVAVFFVSVPGMAGAHGSRGAAPMPMTPMSRPLAQPADTQPLRMPQQPRPQPPADAKSRSNSNANPSPAPTKSPEFNPLVIRREA